MKIFFAICAILINYTKTQNFAPDSILTNMDSNSKCQVTQCGPYQCSTNGFCLNNLTCLCGVSFTSFPENSIYQCCYKRRSQINAFLLEFFVSFGAGHMYTGRGDYAGSKITILLLFIGLNIFIHSAILCYGKNGKVWKWMKYIIIVTSVVGFLTWQILDLIMYGLNKYVDANGVTLKEW
jgi:hypothetical protein